MTAERSDAGTTRQRLMLEAMRLFADEGLNAVALRRVVQAAGAQNSSALHYHFGGRSGLVAGIVDLLREWLEPRWLRRFNALDRRQQPSPYAVVEALYDPVLELHASERFGPSAVRFLARLAWDLGHEGQQLSADLHSMPMQRAETLLRDAAVSANREVLRLRLLMSMANVYHGLSDRSYLRRSPFGPLTLAEPREALRLRSHFYDYLVAGLQGVERPAIDEARHPE
ncbi:MAG: helix-turn-helix domain-containing protein [Pseudomonadota bacterium]|nr:helix-turn-helix domain-containing protein [Pseudomonadota bacterium]